MRSRTLDMLRFSAGQLLTKRLRVALTVFGIAIGVAAVIGIVALGEGIRYQAIETIKAQSDLTLLEVYARSDQGLTQLITPARVKALRNIPHVTAIAPAYTDSYTTKRQTYLPVIAVQGSEIEQVLNLEYTSGRAFQSGAMEVVMGADLKDRLQRNEGIRFNDTFIALIREYDALGMPSDREVALRVTGVLADRDDQFDRMMLIDLETEAMLRGAKGSYDIAFLRVDDPDAVFTVVEEISAQGLEVRGAFEQIRTVNQFVDSIIIVFLIFALFALVVGGLMITTTMITSVYERTREIGITMAVGASEGDVIRLILYECLLIGIVGGGMGNLLGLLFAMVMNAVGKPLIISRLGAEFSNIFGNEIARVSPQMMLAGFVIAVFFSLIAGIYPARKAARMNPVDAIRGAM